jgi:hypothetical protein
MINIFMKTLIDTIKEIIHLSPSRLALIYYNCTISQQENQILVRFAPTEQYLNIGRCPFYARPDALECVRTYEKWQHTGLVVGVIESFLTNANFSFNIVENHEDNTIDIVINSANVQVEYNLDGHASLRHTWRSYDFNTSVDQETLGLINSMIDQVLASYPNAHKSVITNKDDINKIYMLSIYNRYFPNLSGEEKNTHIKAPLLINIISKSIDRWYYARLGRLYSNIGLLAISRGYKTGFCNSFSYEDPRCESIKDVLYYDPETFDPHNFVPLSFISIGLPLDPTSKPNWCYVRQENMTRYDKVTTGYITEI